MNIEKVVEITNKSLTKKLVKIQKRFKIECYECLLSYLNGEPTNDQLKKWAIDKIDKIKKNRIEDY